MKPRVYRHAPEDWRVELPGYGFSRPRLAKAGFHTREAAFKWLAAERGRVSGNASIARAAIPDPRRRREGFPTIVR